MVNLIRVFNCPIYSFHNHVHFDMSEVVFIANGKGSYSINNCVYPVKKGDLLLINKGIIHSCESDPHEPMDAWTLSLNQFTICGLEPDILIGPEFSPCIQVEHADFFHMLFTTLLTQNTDKHAGSAEVCNSLITTICILAHQHLKGDGAFPQHSTNAKDAAEILAYIEKNFKRPVSLNELSRLFHMSPSHINHIMASEYGISPRDYVIRKRINAAQWSLVMTDSAIKDIAYETGYENLDHFIKQFQKRTGLTPSQYRSKYSNVLVYIRPE